VRRAAQGPHTAATAAAAHGGGKGGGGVAGFGLREGTEENSADEIGCTNFKHRNVGKKIFRNMKHV
jgi:hypothetical protein